MTILNNNDFMIELSEKDLTEVTGAEFADGLALAGWPFAACGACGFGLTGFAAVPTVTAFSTAASNTVAFSQNFAANNAFQTSFINIVS
jgi:hypothetical protein